ncbi:MAG: tetratricopeptide repeat protein [Myxococcota bacterium]
MRWLRRAFARGGRRPGSTDDALRRALLLVTEREFEAAEQVLAGVVREDSDEIDAYLALARVYRLRGEIGRAIRIHQNLLLRRDLTEDQRSLALAGLAGDFQTGGFLRRSIAAYEELLERRPDHLGGLRALVRLLADVRDFPRALELQRRLARREGSDRRSAAAALRVEMARALRAEGRSDEARKALRKALRADPSAVEGWMLLGELELERGRTPRAVDAWERVPVLDRRAGARVYPRLEAAYGVLQRSVDYESFLQARLAEDSRDAEARLALARSLAGRGELEEAKAQVHRVLENDPERLDAHATLGRVLLLDPREPELAKQLTEILDVLDRHGLLREREHSL